MTSPTPSPPESPFQAAFHVIYGILSWVPSPLRNPLTCLVLILLFATPPVAGGFTFFLINYDGSGNIRSGAQSFWNDVQNWLNRPPPPPSPTPIATPTPTPTEDTETPTPSMEDVVATITSPENGSTVSQSTTITGTISGLQSPMRAFLVVFSIWSPDEQILWADEIIPEEDGSWVIEDAYREENFERIGHEFRTFVALTDDPEVAERILASENSNGSAKIVTNNWTTTRLADTPERVVRGHYDLLERYCNGEEDITPESRSVYLRTPASADSPDPCTNFATIRLEEPPELLVREARDDGNTAYVTACTLWLPEGEDESSFPGEWRYLTLIQEPSTQIWQIDKMENSSNPGNCRE